MQQLLEIKPYNPDYLTFIYQLNKTAIDMPWELDALKSTLDSPSIICLVGQSNKQPQGFVIVRAVGDEAEILLLAVMDESRRSGIGSALLNSCLANLQEIGAKKIFLEVSELNEPAIGFYEKNHFTRAGFRKDYYSLPNNIKASALVLCRTI